MHSGIKFQKTTWWSEFGCKNGSVPECTTKLVSEVTTKSIKDDDLLQTCVGSFIV